VHTWGIVVAGGTGSRFGPSESGGPKQLDTLAGRRLIDWAVDAIRPVCAGVVVVLRPELVGVTEVAADAVVAGGATRADSVRAGLAAVPTAADAVLVHDAVRPLASTELSRRVLAALTGGADGVVPAVPVTDTVKQVEGGAVVRTVDRDGFVAVQTPQAFRAEVLRRAHAERRDATDDASLVEQVGGRVIVVDGERANIKITWPDDMVIAAALVGRR